MTEADIRKAVDRVAGIGTNDEVVGTQAVAPEDVSLEVIQDLIVAEGSIAKSLSDIVAIATSGESLRPVWLIPDQLSGGTGVLTQQPSERLIGMYQRLMARAMADKMRT